jgi:hypothetical protein
MQKLLASVLIIIIGLLLISTTAECASWVLIAEKYNGSVKYYCDNDSIEKSFFFDTRKVWTKIESSGIGGRSDTYYMEYNCKNKKVRFLESKNKSWKLIPPDSDDEAILNYVCR